MSVTAGSCTAAALRNSPFDVVPPQSLLALAAELIDRVLRFEQPADATVSAFFRERRALGPRERATLADTAYEVLRKRLLFEHLAGSGSGPIARRLAILAWKGDRVFLEAALDPPERGWLASAGSIDVARLPDVLRHNLPAWLAEALERSLGADFWRFVASLDEPAPLDVRVNAVKAKRDAIRQSLAAAGVDAEPTPHSPLGLRVSGHPALHKLAPFANGEIDVQDEGSQLVALLVGARRGQTVVDFCAGAGGKTLALGAEMRSTGRLYAFDTSAHRLAALEPRLARSGLANVYASAIAHERDERVLRLAGKADRVLVDAPCSGLGTLRRHPDLKWRQTPATLHALTATQSSILAAAARLVKPGGRLVYATCSVLDAENEAIAATFDEAVRGAFARLPADELLARVRVDRAAELVSGSALRLWPHRHGTDGFYAVAWERR